MFDIIAQLTGDIAHGITAAAGCAAAAIGVGIIGMKAVESIGRNPGAASKIQTMAIIGMALAEAIAFYVIFLYKIGTGLGG